MNDSVVIEATNLSKRYLIGHRAAADDGLRHAIEHAVRSPLSWMRSLWSLRKEQYEEFWALRDVAFEVKRGEVVGIIGRNGAGKSTLLKLLSRITEPTTGRIRTRGRIASLLEVGTGFHPELTGRENIFLNGAILGMTRHEIKRKFDEIVAFAGIHKFLDTPVKRYSSGMYVRLAFSVAAHLEPEILVVDEVLAVGDAEFQKKCIDKMESVSATEGRTVLFVSHQMAVIQNLCSRCLLLHEGHLVQSGRTEDIVRAYISSAATLSEIKLSDRKDRVGRGDVTIDAVQLLDENAAPVTDAVSGMKIVLRVFFTVRNGGRLKDCRISLVILREMRVYFTLGTDLVDNTALELSGSGCIDFIVPNWPLSGGSYHMNAFVASEGVVQDWVLDAMKLSVIDGDFFGSGKLYHEGWQGESVLVKHTWEMHQLNGAQRHAVSS
jgi:lipopolysaccharide transport system ATP-binding protein